MSDIKIDLQSVPRFKEIVRLAMKATREAVNIITGPCCDRFLVKFLSRCSDGDFSGKEIIGERGILLAKEMLLSANKNEWPEFSKVISVYPFQMGISEAKKTFEDFMAMSLATVAVVGRLVVGNEKIMPSGHDTASMSKAVASVIHYYAIKFALLYCQLAGDAGDEDLAREGGIVAVQIVEQMIHDKGLV